MSDTDLTLPLRELTQQQGENLQQIGVVMTALSQLYAQMDARMTALEQEQSKATILHKDALRLSRSIREKAAGEADRYQLTPAGEKLLRAELKKAVLKQYGIRDLHDLPLHRLTDCERYIAGWLSFRAVMRVRERLEAC